MLTGFARFFLVACAASISHAGCSPQQGNIQKVSSQKAAIVVSKQGRMPTDYSYERFLDSILNRKDIIYDTAAVDAGQVYEWSDEDGLSLKMPLTFHFNEAAFLMTKKGMTNIIGNDNLPLDVPYDEDTAFIFYFKNKKYGWSSAWYKNCNGSFCLIKYFLVADFQHHRLYSFAADRTPQYDRYFGDLDGDDNLDLLLPDYLYNPSSHLPYSDTTEYLTLTGYSLKANGGLK